MGTTGVDVLLTGAGSGAAPRACTTSSIGGDTLDESAKVDDCVVDWKDAGAEAKQSVDLACGSGVATPSANAVIPRYLAIEEAKRR